jgi:tryptophanyl-tRNA synthetase
MKKTIMCGIRPSGRPHIGNYFGAMKQFIDLQNGNDFRGADKYFMIADLHTLDANKGEAMRQASIDIALDYLAIGVDPKISSIFLQSYTSYHGELAMIFSYLVTVPYLMRGHLYKDAEAKGKEVNAGTFLYPVLMTADMLLYDVTDVAVGIDNKQHIEIARDVVRKFNHEYEEYFNEPKEYILKETGLVPGLDGRKMSKSYGNHIPLFSTRDEIEKLVKKIVTDSGSDIPENVYAIHKLVRDEKDLKKIYDENKGKYKILKDMLVDDLDAFIKPLRERREELASNMDYVYKVLKEGNEKTAEVASKRMGEIKKILGLGM